PRHELKFHVCKEAVGASRGAFVGHERCVACVRMRQDVVSEEESVRADAGDAATGSGHCRELLPALTLRPALVTLLFHVIPAKQDIGKTNRSVGEYFTRD